MEATVTIKATPQELDVIRRALKTHEETMIAQSKVIGRNPRDQHEDKAEALRAQTLSGKLA